MSDEVVGDEEARGLGSENSREVAPAIGAAIAAMAAAAAWLRKRAQSGNISAQELEGCIQQAHVLGSAEAALTTALEEAFSRTMDRGDRAKTPSPSALFRAGFDYGRLAGQYGAIPEEKVPEVWGEKPPPPPDWEMAWAIFRAQLAQSGR